MKHSGMKLPDTRYAWYHMKINLEECEKLCLKNCSCTAYAKADIRKGGRGCYLWFNDLIDIEGYSEDGPDIYIRMAASELERLKFSSESIALTKIESEELELPLISFDFIEKATNSFSHNNKLGEGGFGPIFKADESDCKRMIDLEYHLNALFLLIYGYCSLVITREISYNGYTLNEFVAQRTSAYVSQRDRYTAEMTVRETLELSGRCQGFGFKQDHESNHIEIDTDMLMELLRREKDLGIEPDDDLDTFVKIVGIDDLKKEVDKRGKDEAVTSRTFQSSPRETARKCGIFREQDIDSLFMEVSQGEKVIKSKCKSDLALKKKDYGNDDQGNSESGRGHGQGKGFSSRKAGTSTQRSSSDADRRKSSDKQVLTNPDVLIQGESQESHKFMQTLKLKGKETTVYCQDPKLQKLDEEISKRLFKSHVEVDPRFKGKAKVDEPVKVYMPIMDLEAKSDEDTSLILKKKNIQTTSDRAHVVQDQDLVNSDMTMKQATSDRAQVAQQSTQLLKTTSSGFEARVIRGKEARDESGLGSSKEKRVNNTTSNPTSLSEPGVGTTPERLNQLESIQMVYHSVRKEDIMLYFMIDVRVFQIRKNAIRLNYFKSDIQRQKKLYSVKSDRPYYPKYRAHNGDIVEIKPNTAKIITTFLGIKGLEFNLESDKANIIRLDQDIKKAKINDLRAAIFQTGEDTIELKDAKRRM
ncbi:hypothetical protein AgCh_024823 [Apium graveolens]